MKKILVLGASSSRSSINKRFAAYVADLLDGVEADLIDLNDYEMPLFSIDREKDLGSPSQAEAFANKIGESDGVIISFAEHNGSYSAAFKNLMDWTSRREGKLWQDKKYFLLSTSPGGRGGMTVLNAAVSQFPFMGAEVIAHFSLPFFHKNFTEEGIQDAELTAKLQVAVNSFQEAING